MKINMNNFFEKTKKMNDSLLLFLVLVAYVFKNIFYFYAYAKDIPQMIEEFTSQTLEIQPIALALGFALSSLIIMFIVRLVVNYLYTSLRQRGLINEDAKGFAKVFYICYILASAIVGIVNLFAFLAPEVMVVGNSILTLVVHSFFYLMGYIYINKSMIRRDTQTVALKLISMMYLVYFYAISIINTIMFVGTLDLVLGIISIALTGGMHLLINKLKLKWLEDENAYKEEMIKHSISQQAKATVEEKKEIFKGFGF